MMHPLDHVIASDLSYRVLEKRRREMQLVSPSIHEAHQAIQARAVFDSYPADRPAIRDSYQGEVTEQHRLFLRG